VAVVVFVSQSSREGPLTAVTARDGRVPPRWEATCLPHWNVPASSSRTTGTTLLAVNRRR